MCVKAIKKLVSKIILHVGFTCHHWSEMLYYFTIEDVGTSQYVDCRKNEDCKQKH